MHTLRNSLQFAGRALLIAGGFGLALAADLGNQAPVRLSRETCATLQGLSIPASATGAPGTENSAASFTCVAE
jgi:hypothetical protein